MELLLLGLGPSEDSTSQSDTNIIASSPETNKKKKCAVRRPVSVKAEVHSDDDEESSTPNKRCRKSDEASTLENFHEKKCLRFHDSIESHKKADQSFRVNRKGTPYKHSRRAIEIEE